MQVGPVIPVWVDLLGRDECDDGAEVIGDERL
jgi:hypothetical protein